MVMPLWSALGGLSSLISGMGTGFVPPFAHDPARDAAIRAMLPLVPDTGWTRQTLRLAAGENAELLFPGGPAEMVEAHSDLGDWMMEEGGRSIVEARVSRRVRALILLRLDQAEPDRDAVRRGLSVLSMPGARGAAVHSLARTVDTIWHAAGDRSADMSWYSKRLLLAGVYSSTLLYWLKRGPGEETEAFLDRQLAAVARLGRMTHRGAKPPTATQPGAVAGERERPSI